MINHTGEGSTNKKTGVRAVEEWKMLRFLLGVTRMVFIMSTSEGQLRVQR